MNISFGLICDDCYWPKIWDNHRNFCLFLTRNNYLPTKNEIKEFGGIYSIQFTDILFPLLQNAQMLTNQVGRIKNTPTASPKKMGVSFIGITPRSTLT